MTPITTIQSWTNFSYNGLEASLLPTQGVLVRRVSRYALQCLQLCFFAPLAGVCSLLSRVDHWVNPPSDSPLVAYAKRPSAWLPNAPLPKIPIGVATAAFHDNGPLVHGDTQFGRLYLKDHPERFEPNFQFPNMWEYPERFIERLQDIGLQWFRFSVPRDLVEPQEGLFNDAALEKTVQFCQLLKDAGITPMVTLEHFARPLYQTFEKAEGIDAFVRYVDRVMEKLYPIGVRHVITFN